MISATVHDATYVLDVILDDATEATILEQTTDTAGYTKPVFALFDLLGMQFAPRIPDLGDQQKGKDREWAGTAWVAWMPVEVSPASVSPATEAAGDFIGLTTHCMSLPVLVLARPCPRPSAISEEFNGPVYALDCLHGQELSWCRAMAQSRRCRSVGRSSPRIRDRPIELLDALDQPVAPLGSRAMVAAVAGPPLSSLVISTLPQGVGGWCEAIPIDRAIGPQVKEAPRPVALRKLPSVEEPRTPHRP